MNSLEQLNAIAWQRYRAGDRRGAEQACRELLASEPAHGDSLYLLGVIVLEENRIRDAIDYLRRASTLSPERWDYQHAFGEALRLGKESAQAVEALRAALRIEPRRAASHNSLGLALLDQGNADDAVAAFRQAVACNPDFARAHLNLGLALQNRGDLREAKDCFEHAIRVQLDYAIAHNNLGAILLQLEQTDAALESLWRAVELQPNYPEAHYNLGNALLAAEDVTAAIASYHTALRLRPGYANAHAQLGAAQDKMGLRQEAMNSYQSALRSDPEHGEAWQRLANLYMVRRQWDEALAAFTKAAALLPDPEDVLPSLVHVRQMICDWSTLDRDRERLWQLTAARIAAGKPPRMPPFFALVLPWTAERQLTLGRAEADGLAARHAASRRELVRERPRGSRDRLRIGYISGDFYDHATSHLMQGLFGLHDRRRFEVYVYSYGPDDGSDYRRRIASDCDRFVDVRALSATETARRIRDDEVDVLVDLMGYCGFSRFEVMAHRPAPVQACWLIYPGTTGADFIDYFIGDPLVTPLASTADFRERLVLLPHSYQINDHEQPIAAEPVSRRDQGLPEVGFVFCSLNNSFKFEPLIFGVWARILAQTPGSVLWLLSGGETMESNLRREATARGLDPTRLIFAQTLPKPQHLARLRLADLFLDTYHVNAHTTASDALWAGLPLLTCPGRTFASRVAASLLTAVGLPELIAPRLPAYEQTAIELARDAGRIAGLRAKLAAQRTSFPLFDTRRFVRNLERAYEAMWAIYMAGNLPRHIEVVEPADAGS